MIKKLESNIFYLIMISLSVIILGIILVFSILNYRNTINSTTNVLDRFMNIGTKRDNDEKTENTKPEDKKIDFKDLDIDGLYEITVENETVVNDLDDYYDEKIEEYAIKVCKKKNESGIIGKYIYKKRKVGENLYNVTLMENESAILHIKIILIISIMAAIISMIVIYIIAKRVSKTIVEPVQKTFEKQKQFISDASHELKTPLAVIEANADVLENEIGKNKWMNYIQNEIQSMDKLINELLLLAKIENIDTLKNYKEFNISEEAEMIVSMFESIAYEKKVKININIPKDIIMNGDKEDIKHILSTLIDNAIKHTDSGKEITIEINKEKNEIVIQVKNMGKPIPEEEKEKIFERFYRVDKSRNRNEKRYGLGLAIAKSAVEKYGGKFEVNCKDGITNFKVHIPN